MRVPGAGPPYGSPGLITPESPRRSSYLLLVPGCHRLLDARILRSRLCSALTVNRFSPASLLLGPCAHLQMVVEKMLAKQGTSRTDLGREAFTEKARTMAFRPHGKCLPSSEI